MMEHSKQYESATMFIGYTVIVLCVLLGQIGAEAKVHIFLEDAEIISVDPTYSDIIITDDNKVAVNWSIVKIFPPETYGHFELSGLLMGEYVIPTGLNWWRQFCEVLQDPIIYGPFFSQMGMSPDSCPPEPDHYILEGYAAPVENLPETFRENKYRLLFDIIYEGKILLSSIVYVDVRN